MERDSLKPRYVCGFDDMLRMRNWHGYIDAAMDRHTGTAG